MHSRLTVTRGFPAGGVCRDGKDHSPFGGGHSHAGTSRTARPFGNLAVLGHSVPALPSRQVAARVSQTKAARYGCRWARRRGPGHAPIEDHGVIGDLHTAALVSTDGDIDAVPAPVRLPVGLRCAAGPGPRRPVQRPLCRGHPHQADVPHGLEHPADQVPRGELGRRGRRLHGAAGAAAADAPAGAHRAGRPGAGGRRSAARPPSTTAAPAPRSTSSRVPGPSPPQRASWSCAPRCRWPPTAPRRWATRSSPRARCWRCLSRGTAPPGRSTSPRPTTC